MIKLISFLGHSFIYKVYNLTWSDLGPRGNRPSSERGCPLSLELDNLTYHTRDRWDNTTSQLSQPQNSKILTMH